MSNAAPSVMVVIPARYGSSRFPGKPLVMLGRKPMIQHVYEQAAACRVVTEVLVATDDQRIKQAVEGVPRQKQLKRQFGMHPPHLLKKYPY